MTQGPVPTIARTAAGVYSLSLSGLGGGCPLPQLNPSIRASVHVTFEGGGCGGGGITTTVFTSDGADHWWTYMFVGVEAGASARAGGSSALPVLD